MSRVIVYGIKNCDTIRKARSWLDDHGVGHQFHDYRVDGVQQEQLDHWAGLVGWEMLLNRAGTTFRALPPDQKIDLDQAKAVSLMLDQPAMIKRPVLDVDGQITVGFKPDVYAELFGGLSGGRDQR